MIPLNLEYALNQAAEERWKREQDYFDAVEYSSTAIPAATIERYRKCSKPFLVAENPFHTLGNLTGKRVLEIGCGDGGNSVLLSLCGARQVVGIELCTKAVEAARKRAKAHRLSEDQIRFVNALPGAVSGRQPDGKVRRHLRLGGLASCATRTRRSHDPVAKSGACRPSFSLLNR